jgi:hypothetical protein
VSTVCTALAMSAGSARWVARLIAAPVHAARGDLHLVLGESGQDQSSVKSLLATVPCVTTTTVRASRTSCHHSGGCQPPSLGQIQIQVFKRRRQ